MTWGLKEVCFAISVDPKASNIGKHIYIYIYVALDVKGN